MAEEAAHLKEVMGADLTLRSIDDPLELLGPVIQFGEVVTADDADHSKAAEQMEEAAGIFKGMGRSCKIHNETVSNPALQADRPSGGD